jgi:hypothetical protein
MAEETKSKKEETKTTTSKETTPTVESSAIKNTDAENIAKLVTENAKLKDVIVNQKKASARASKRRLGSTGIVGLQGLKGFGRK